MRISYGRDELVGLLPQNPPFLFLDSAAVDGERAQGSYRITGREAVGHFVNNPVFPASLMIEALGQLACVWLYSTRKVEQVFFVGLERVKCRRICTSGDALELTVECVKVREPLAYFRGLILVGNEKTAACESLTLSFSGIR